MIDDRPRDQLRKEGHKQRICDERTVLHLSLVRVHNKGNLLEGEKADPQRQQNPPQRRRRAKHRIDGRQEKIEILEIEQHAQVGRHCRCHQRFCRPARQKPVKQVIPRDAADHDQQIGNIEIAVEPK